ncbi:N-formyl peptide receptor 2-like [Phyllostomus hastatus]|uniref:N-formyl peptide receptor 2-like n=1 Tax=Phyllostomus hastatus TaxID=9423 RepID=UPI001E680CCA|nr:N-formyl peptide receptor 2-like [Phyllostomus hastatus]XP_045703226.1 N-formyl peptide receptor 2-like [Phyllostomus hastatus]XP_045703227.1 N-formyl peptide receptor 2-like [Phyllostomus hastatus]XP_045703228.1 N-formyl peptide receptor 2-like [Phyllostomus hastatus]
MALYIFTMVAQGIICVLSILGNGLVIWVAGFRMAITVTTLCCLNLALADFLFAGTLPFFMVVSAREGQWPFGWLMCKLINFLGDTNLLASVFFTAFIALDRCICVLCPVWAQNHRTVSLAMKVIIVPWILAAVLNLPAFILFTTQKDEENNVYCSFNLEIWGNITEEEKMHRLFTLVKTIGISRFVVGFTFPMSIIAICYSLVAVKICKKGMTSSSRPFWVLSAVVATFFICWFPCQLCLLLSAVWTKEILFEGKYKILLYLRVLTGLLAFFNSSINPTLYVFQGKDFQKRVIHSLPASLVRALTKDSAPTSDTTTKSVSLPTEANL